MLDDKPGKLNGGLREHKGERGLEKKRAPVSIKNQFHEKNHEKRLRV